MNQESRRKAGTELSDGSEFSSDCLPLTQRSVTVRKPPQFVTVYLCPPCFITGLNIAAKNPKVLSGKNINELRAKL